METDNVKRPMAVAFSFMGFGMLSGSTLDGQPCLYYGGSKRFPRGIPPKFEAFAAFTCAEVQKLQIRPDCEPVPGAPVEIFGYWEDDDDPESGVVLVWRVPCRKIMQH